MREDAEDKAERIFDHLTDDLARTPAMSEDDLDFYVEGTQSRLAGSSYDLPATTVGREPTKAELDVLECLSRGLTVQMAAQVLGRTKGSITASVNSVRPKLRAKNALHAVAEALRRQLIR